MSLVLADTSVWVRERQAPVAALLATVIRGNMLAMVLPIALELLRSAPDARRLSLDARRYDALRQIELTPFVARRARAIQKTLAARGHHRAPSPTGLIAAAAAESAGAELWHCDRDFELIAEVTGQPLRRVGE